jgi:large subunit ribosomal protein L1
MQQNDIDKINAFLAENKGKRKFVQSVELAINFKGIDFNKTDNRLNLSVVLPFGKGKQSNAAVFTDDLKISEQAKKLDVRVISSAELQLIAKDQLKQNELLSYEMLAQPNLMPQIAKAVGQFLGPRGKMPKPIVSGDLETILKNVSRSVYIRSKGKYLPTVHCVVGTESMPINEITSNIDAVFNDVAKKVGRQNIRSTYIKLTMSKPLKLL